MTEIFLSQDQSLRVVAHEIHQNRAPNGSMGLSDAVVEFWLCRAGMLTFLQGDRMEVLTPEYVIGTCGGAESLRLKNSGAAPASILRVQCATDRFRKLLNSAAASTHAAVANFLLEASPALLFRREAAAPVHAIIAQILHPPVPETARDLWYSGKFSELVAHAVFREALSDEMFCKKQQRLNRERCARAIAQIQQNLEEPPDADTLAATCDCSPSHLSRIFREHTGLSIPAAIRKFRLDHAADLLATGRCDVLEAATAVGYNSLGSFTRAFSAQFRCSPGRYAAKYAKNLRE